MDTPVSDGLSQQEYLEERKELYKYQQAAYDSYEKTLVTLSGSFFTLTAAILTYLQKEATGSNTTLPLAGKGYLVLGLALFSVSLTILLGCFFMNARGYTFEIERIERARRLTNEQPIGAPCGRRHELDEVVPVARIVRDRDLGDFSRADSSVA